MTVAVASQALSAQALPARAPMQALTQAPAGAPPAGGLPAADHRIEIAPATVELGPGRSVRTLAYNGQVPGPLLRMKEGRPVRIDVTNHGDRPEVVHWHGLYLPPEVDGAVEEGTPAIAPGATARYDLVPRPGGFRWYHTHGMAMGDFSRGLYGGQHGPLWIEPADNPGRYDQELFLVLHDWLGRLSGNGDGSMNPVYGAATINGRMLGAGEPLRVRQGQRVVLHVLNASATDVHWVALAGHRLTVIALDGNPVPAARAVPMLRLAPAERASVLVTLDNPGVWVFGEVRRHVQAAGMGIVVEYAGRGGAPRWDQPAALAWDYAQFGAGQGAGAGPDAAGTGGVPDAAATGASAAGAGDEPEVIPLVFESRFRGHGAEESWTINGRSWPQVPPPRLVAGHRYRLRFINRSADDHPVHLHRHNFELRTLAAALDGRGGMVVPRGLFKDVLLVDANTTAEVDFMAAHPGDTLFHCHQQDHMDMGFMMLFRYG